MPHINLLPWREELRRERQRQFINIAVGAAILMGAVIVLVHIRMNGIIENQNSRNTFMTETIAKVDRDIREIQNLEKEKEALLARMKIIQELQGSRSQIVHIYDELAKAVPENAFLIKASRSGTNIKLEGVADSNDYVSEFMRNLNASAWFTNPKLTVIEAGRKDYPGGSWFQLEVTQREQDKDEEGKTAK